MYSDRVCTKLSVSNRGGSRIFFRRGCTRLLLYFNTNKPHSFFLQNTSCIKKPQFIWGGGGSTPCTLPLDPSLSKIKRIVYSGHNEVGVGGKVVERKDSTVLNLVESVSDFEYFSLNLGL